MAGRMSGYGGWQTDRTTQQSAATTIRSSTLDSLPYMEYLASQLLLTEIMMLQVLPEKPPTGTKGEFGTIVDRSSSRPPVNRNPSNSPPPKPPAPKPPVRK